MTPIPTQSSRKWFGVSATLLVLFLIYFETARSMVSIWNRSETFAHCFLILPISAYLIWMRRKSLAEIPTSPDYRGLLLLAGLGFGWLLADAGSVQVVAQYCLISMVPAAVWTMLGLPFTRAIAFPLGFLFFAVPNGEFLIPHMMDFTADFVVTALQATGIPVYREGTFFTIPSGQWSVVEGCSGLRYLIASFTLGTLYAYLTYRSTRRRIIFALLSLIVPVIANGMRAYMIVMIAHLSDMKLALGVDHLIYGWVFFGVVMLLLFWIGAFWREDLHDNPADEKKVSGKAMRKEVSGRSFAMAGISIILLAALWPAYTAYLDSRPVNTKGLAITLPEENQGWAKQAEPLSDWQPTYVGTDAQTMLTYRKNDQVVSVYMGYYRTQRPGALLISTQNYMVKQKHPIWNNVGEKILNISLGEKNKTIKQTLLRAPDQRLLIWSWNKLDGIDTVNPYLAKLLLAKAKLTGQHDDGTVIIVATPYAGMPESAAATLQSFIKDMLPTIETSLLQTAGKS